MGLSLDAGFLTEIHRGVADWTLEHGWELMPDLMWLVAHDMKFSCDAAVFTAFTPASFEFLRTGCFPAVRVLDPTLSSWEAALAPVPKVMSDSAQIGRLGARHLLTLGERTLVFNRVGTGADIDRMAAGFAEEVRAAGLPSLVLNVQVRSETPSEVAQTRYLERLIEGLSPLPLPLGIMAEDDRYAAVLVRAARALGLRIPDDIAILGVDNLDPWYKAVPVALSSVDSNLRAIGYAAAELAAQLAAGVPAPAGPVVVPPRAVVARDSTATYAGRHLKATEALRYMRRHFRNPELTSAKLAARFKLSPFGLQRIVQAAAGVTPHEELLRLRVQAAAELLVTSPLKLDAVASECGLGSGKNLCRVFRAAHGMTPGEWRESHRPRRWVQGAAPESPARPPQ